MRSILTLTALLAALTRQVAGQGIAVTAPAAGAALVAGQPTTITVQDSGTAPGISLLQGGQVYLMIGGATDATSKQLAALGALNYPATSIAASINPGLAQSVTNGFYLKIVSNINDGGSVVNYSGRFSISGMTGTTEQTYISAATAAGSAVPALVYNPGSGSGNTAAAGADQFNVPYNLQQGLTKYAPMQPVPPTQITKGGNPTPLYSTSSYVVATTYLPPPTIKTTITQQQTASFSSVENPAPAQSLPTGDMAKYLARWKD